MLINNYLAIPDVPNVSLVAFYGDKPLQLIALIRQLQTYLANHELIGKYFIPYQLEQVHGTIIGCEGLKTKLGIINKWFYERQGKTLAIDLAGLIDYLQTQVNLPITIRLGGYDRTHDYNHLSWQQHLYFRSFQLQPGMNQTIPVIIGWSWANNSVSLEIDNLRRNLQKFNLLHKYHTTTDAVDNDFYLRLGTINSPLTSEIRQANGCATPSAIATKIRHLLTTQPATYIRLNLDNLAFAQYQDLSLTPATTKVIPVTQLTASTLLSLY
jgi:hypothetical protein